MYILFGTLKQGDQLTLAVLTHDKHTSNKPRDINLFIHQENYKTLMFM